METVYICLAIGGVIAAVAIFWWISTWNALIALKGQVAQTIATLAAQYRQRFDLIPDVHRAAKAAVAAQCKYFDKILDVRRAAHSDLKDLRLGDLPPDYVPTTLGATGKGMKEDNPAMNVDGYVELQRILKDTEKDVAAARRFHAAAIAEYNVAVRSFPGRYVASVHGFQPIPDVVITRELEEKPDYGIEG